MLALGTRTEAVSSSDNVRIVLKQRQPSEPTTETETNASDTVQGDHIGEPAAVSNSLTYDILSLKRSKRLRNVSPEAPVQLSRAQLLHQRKLDRLAKNRKTAASSRLRKQTQAREHKARIALLEEENIQLLQENVKQRLIIDQQNKQIKESLMTGDKFLLMNDVLLRKLGLNKKAQA